MDPTDVLFEAIKHGDMAQVEALLAADADLARARTGDGVSAVLLALYYDQTAIAERLIAQAGPLNIFEAAAAGRAAEAGELLAADPALANAVAPDGFSPLGLAAFFGRPDVAALLVAHGAAVNKASENRMRVMPLHSAVASRQREITALLLEHGADVNAAQADDFTPLHEAAQNGDLDLAQLLLRYGADAQARKADGQSALDLARAYQHPDVVALLEPLEQGSTPTG